MEGFKKFKEKLLTNEIRKLRNIHKLAIVHLQNNMINIKNL
jgi:hypothetical protein